MSMSMFNVRRQGGFALMILLAVLLSAPAFAQGGRGQGGQGGRGGAEGGGRDGGRQRFEEMTEEQREEMMEQFRERMAERQAEQDEQLREEIGASEEEFELLQPKIERVRQLTRERQMASAAGFGGGRGGQAGGRGGRGGGFGGLFETSDEGEALTEAQQELREVLEDKAVAADVKDALDDYREARDAMDEAISEAREDLRGLLTARQEAYFVVNGMLD